MNKNWERAAMRFASARHVDRQGMLDVTFENGDHFLVAVESVLPAATYAPHRHPGSRTANHAVHLAAPDWARMRIGETGDVLEVPAGDSVVEIPWDRIRSTADPEFRAHLADQAVERAGRLGGRIRAMRLQAGLTSAALAEKVGVPREVVADLEAGKIEPQTDLIEHIAIALGGVSGILPRNETLRDGSAREKIRVPFDFPRVPFDFPYEARGSDVLRAHQALAYYRQLYELERAAKDFSDPQRLQMRQDLSVPILGQFHAWLTAQRPEVLPKSPMGEAIGYALNNWAALIRYTETGFLAIDNNISEREMKRIAIGRKNWLTVGSPRGGQTAAVLFSFTSTCQRLNVEPWAYLQDVLTRLPTMPVGQLGDLLPEHWQAARQTTRASAATLVADPSTSAPDSAS